MRRSGPWSTARTSDFTLDQRRRIFSRDGDRCLRCGRSPVTMQHRRAKGSGGRGPKSPELTCADGLVLCGTCNSEAEGYGQAEALRCGWKVARSCPVPCNMVPYFDRMTRNWWLADDVGDRQWVDPGWAMDRVQKILAMVEFD